MRRPSIKFFAVLMIMLVTAACTPRIQPVYNVDNQPLPRGAATLSQDRLDRIAQESAASRDWLIEKLAPGQFRIIQKWRTHSAEAKLTIGPAGYSIIMISASNLHESEGHIHRAYNKHVSALETDLQRRLMAAAAN